MSRVILLAAGLAVLALAAVVAVVVLLRRSAGPRDGPEADYDDRRPAP